MRRGGGWQPAIAALGKLLEKQGSADASVVLSGPFARYLIVPWSDAVSGEEELTALARHRCGQVYGPLAGDWEVRLSIGGFGAPMLACGVERGLLEALRQACEAAGVRLASVQPALMAAFNHWRGEMSGGGWFGIAEAGRLTLALAYQGGWHAVHSRHLDGPLAEVVPGVLEQELLLASLDDAPRRALLFAPEQAGFSLAATGNWTVRALKLAAYDGFSPHTDAAFGLAMSGGA